MILDSWPFTLYQTLYNAFLASLAAYAAYYTYWQCTTGASHRRFISTHGCKPAKQWRRYDPILGLDILWDLYKAMKAHNGLEKMKGRFDHFGADTAYLRIFGRTLFATIEPENLKCILSLRFKEYSLGEERKKAMIPFLGEGILETDGEKWHQSRELLRPSFTRNQIGDLELFERHVQNLIQAIPKNGEMVDLQPLFFKFTLDAATEFLFGESVLTLKPEEANPGAAEFVRAFTYCQTSLEGQSDDWGILALFLPNPKLKRQYKIIHAFVDSLIEKAKQDHERYEQEKEHSNRRIFIHEVLAQTTNAAKIRAEALNILMAGRDTTASLLSNVWFELSRRPTIWNALRKEIDTLDGAIPSFEELKQLKYLRALLNESLRLHPVVPENSRQAEVDTCLPVGGGPDGKSPVFIEKGKYVLWSAYAMHRRKDLFGDDAEEFKPERWLDDSQSGEKGLRVGWEYLPFNGGPRICIGRKCFYFMFELSMNADSH
ncbi:hypothetical protein P7C71_g5080, partial [Lecanoromycetidae sp. Uapishka_2]